MNELNDLKCQECGNDTFKVRIEGNAIVTIDTENDTFDMVDGGDETYIDHDITPVCAKCGTSI